MGWDIFISHASENKKDIAIPLKNALEKAGVSVWLDVEQISLGDSFRSMIDQGLQNCRFGVVILSPDFFKKPWAQAELDAFMNMEMSVQGRTRLLPVVYGMSFDELQQHSALLAGRLSVHWDQGLDAVVAAIVGAATGNTEAVRSIQATPDLEPSHSVELDSLVLFMFSDGRLVYLESEEIEMKSDGVELTLVCGDPRDAAIVQELSKSHRERIALAFGTTASIGHVEEARLKQAKGKQFGIIHIRHDEHYGGYGMEISLAGHSADDMAVMRARRILLNEKLGGTRAGSMVDDISQHMLDMYVAGQDGFIKVTESPLPSLYQRLHDHPDLFIAVARLTAVMHLCLSNTVEHVYQIDLRLQGTELHVAFSGRRAKQFSNVDPQEIQIEGMLVLKK